MLLGIPKKILLIGIAAVVVGFFYFNGAAKKSADAGELPASGCRVAVTADVLNVRSAPNSGSSLVGKYKRDAAVDAQLEVQNGFRKLTDNKWAAEEFLKPVTGAKCG